VYIFSVEWTFGVFFWELILINFTVELFFGEFFGGSCILGVFLEVVQNLSNSWVWNAWEIIVCDVCGSRKSEFWPLPKFRPRVSTASTLQRHHHREEMWKLSAGSDVRAYNIALKACEVSGKWREVLWKCGLVMAGPRCGTQYLFRFLGLSSFFRCKFSIFGHPCGSLGNWLVEVRGGRLTFRTIPSRGWASQCCLTSKLG